MKTPLLLLAAVLIAVPARAADAPDSRAVVPLLERVADWQLAHPAKHAPHNWVYGPFYAGLVALSEISAEPRFAAAMREIGNKNEWKLGPDPYNADDQVVGQAYIEVYLKDRKPEQIAKVRETFDFVLSHPKELWYWCDALFMGPPTWTRLAVATGNSAYLDYGMTFWDTTTKQLYDADERLYYRDDSYIKKRGANGQKIFWSRGNGWVLAGLARVLQFLPADHAARPKLEAQFKAMSARIAELQQTDGLWRSSLLDAENYPAKEASGSAFFTYGLAWGINQRLLDRGKYESVVRRGWAALEACVEPDGKVVHIQPIGASPEKFPADFSEPYGVGAVLLAGTEVYRLLGGAAPAAAQAQH